MTIAKRLDYSAVETKERELKEALNNLVAQTLLVKGCQKCEMYQLNEERSHFFMIVIFKSQKAIRLYEEDEQIQALRKEVKRYTQKDETYDLKLPQCLTKLGLKEKK